MDKTISPHKSDPGAFSFIRVSAAAAEESRLHVVSKGMFVKNSSKTLATASFDWPPSLLRWSAAILLVLAVLTPISDSSGGE
ncbi:unnamed protein product [Plutella xylostella]|uniref:(diamondback moth) hypothetical protein n=1 Tax=Plutella xylostella TaxID=51655 RepID=A0A8S4D6R7_PLUXY|nr:unnamed protein product [Plutella xylostella]